MSTFYRRLSKGIFGDPNTARRPDIQGLRAIAVLSVVSYHFFPTRLTGGFVGVDVFFVISGFLITSILIREYIKTGRINFTQFYARRIRRLVPAATVVIAATLIASFFVVGKIRFLGYLTDAIYSALSAANIRFAQDATGYFAVVDPSPFQHFWSLAVEEQFYFVWPLLLLLSLSLKRRGILVASTVIGVICVVTFIVSVLLTTANSSHAYYSLSSRAWELMIGAAVAMLVACEVTIRNSLVSFGLLTAGLFTIAGSILIFDESTSFPGPMAILPVLGAAAVIYAGSGPVEHTSYFAVLSNIRPIRLLGDASYSIYLWHWPIVILAPAYFTGASRHLMIKALLVSILIGIISYYLIERTTNSSPHVANPTQQRMQARRSLLGGFATACLLVGSCFTLAATLPTGLGAPIKTTANSTVTASLGGPSRNEIILSGSLVVTNTNVAPANLKPAVADIKSSLADPFKQGCLDFGGPYKQCQGGDPKGTRTVVLIGDSHAGHLYPAVDAAAKLNHWRLLIFAKNSCPATVIRITFRETGREWPECAAWQKQEIIDLKNAKPDLVIYANNMLLYERTRRFTGTFTDAWSTAIYRSLAEISKTSKVLYIGQFPWQKQDPVKCISNHSDNLKACQTPLSTGLPAWAVTLDKDVARRAHATYFDLSQAACAHGICPTVSGNVAVYRDETHMTVDFSRSLATFMGQAMNIVMES